MSVNDVTLNVAKFVPEFELLFITKVPLVICLKKFPLSLPFKSLYAIVICEVDAKVPLPINLIVPGSGSPTAPVVDHVYGTPADSPC